MAHNVEPSMSSTCSDDFQTASEGLGRLFSSELKAIVQGNGPERAASSENTNPFTASQVRANLDHHKQTYPQPDEDAWPGCSGSTNPFTSIQLRMIHERREYNTQSKKRLGTKHPALQGPLLEPRPGRRNRSVHQGDPSKQDKSVRLLRFVGNGRSTNQVRVHVFERGESSRQGARAGAQQRRSSQSTRGSAAARASARTYRRSIARAILKMGAEASLSISTQKIGLSEKRALHTGTSEFALTQSQHDFGIKLRIAKLPSDQDPSSDQDGTHNWKALTWPLELDLFFDPNSDAVLLVNNTILDTREMLVIKELPVTRQLPRVPGKKPIRIGALEKAALQPSSSYGFFLSGRHMFDMTILPRRYVAMTATPLRRLTQGKRTVDMLSQQAVQLTTKRTKTTAANDKSSDPSNDMSNNLSVDLSKGKGKASIAPWKGKEKARDDRQEDKGKGKATYEASDVEATDGQQTTDIQETTDGQETTDASNASTLIQGLPADELVSPTTSPFPSISSSELQAGHSSAESHPLTELPRDATIKIANATREEDYTLVRRNNIAKQDNTLVYKAHHSKIPGKLVAVKVWHSYFDLDFVPGAGVRVISQVSTHFLIELKNHMKVSKHPAIARLYSFDVRLLALYMEHVDAHNLASHRQNGRNPYCTLDDSEAKRVLYDMADALEFIHSKDVVHNDIKPSNILYNKERGPVLIDFGWSSDTKTVHCAGSPWYIPPEYADVGMRGPAGDIFAFGIVMLFAMGKIPLPELLSPPLKFHIGLLRSKGPEAIEAKATMFKWLRLVRKSLHELLAVREEGIGGMLEEAVLGMADMDVRARLTASELHEFIESY